MSWIPRPSLKTRRCHESPQLCPVGAAQRPPGSCFSSPGGSSPKLQAPARPLWARSPKASVRSPNLYFRLRQHSRIYERARRPPSPGLLTASFLPELFRSLREPRLDPDPPWKTQWALPPCSLSSGKQFLRQHVTPPQRTSSASQGFGSQTAGMDSGSPAEERNLLDRYAVPHGINRKPGETNSES